METAVGDPGLGCPSLVERCAVVDVKPKRAEFKRYSPCPDQITQHSQILLKVVRHGFGDQRGQSHRGGIGEIVAVDRAEVDAHLAPGRNRLDRVLNLRTNPQSPGKTVGGSKGQKGENRLGSEEVVDGRGEGTVASADDDHGGFVGERALDGRAHLIGVGDRVAGDQFDPPFGQKFASLFKGISAVAAHRVDHQHGLFGESVGSHHGSMLGAANISRPSKMAQIAPIPPPIRTAFVVIVPQIVSQPPVFVATATR